mmetsp:Transcript_6217/g.12819  ORF Transcript_6217/g.12819 Transcript_6217/m.12819 type:complete len:80 (-) Transcript_6217:17-256(-)
MLPWPLMLWSEEWNPFICMDELTNPLMSSIIPWCVPAGAAAESKELLANDAQKFCGICMNAIKLAIPECVPIFELTMRL